MSDAPSAAPVAQDPADPLAPPPLPSPRRELAGDVLASLGTALLLATLVTVPFLLFTLWFGVGFANPQGFWLALIALPLLLLYVL